METKGGKKTNGHICGLYCPCGRMSAGHMVVKIFLAIAMIGLGTVIAMEVFYSIGKGSMAKQPCYGEGGVQMMQRFEGEKAGGMLIGRGTNVFYKQEMPPMPERVFGAVTKIEGNKITILNNAAEEQMILSMAETVIISSSTEVGLSALKVGENVVIFGAPNKDKIMEAKYINIQQ